MGEFWLKAVDRLRLVVLAAGVLAVLVFVVSASRNYFGVNREWMLFGLAAGAYTVAMVYTLRKVGLLCNGLRMGAIVTLVEMPVVVLCVIFTYQLLPLPQSMPPYFIGGIALGVLTTGAIDYLFRSLPRRHRPR